MKNVMDEEKIALLESEFCSAYKLYLQSMRDEHYKKEERIDNLSRYQSMRRVLEIIEYSDADIRQLEYEIEQKHIFLESKMTEIASYRYTHNDGDQIWDDSTTFYKKEDGTYLKCYCDGYYGIETSVGISYDEIVANMKDVRNAVKGRREDITLYGAHDPRTRSGYDIRMDLETSN